MAHYENTDWDTKPPITPALTRPAVSESEMKDWAGGAKRSKAMPPWNMSPWKALHGMLTRFVIGMKYGINNWKKALSVGHGMDVDAQRAAWHEGEPGPGKGADDNSALGFVRQFIAHADEHKFNVFQLVDKPVGAQSSKGDDLKANAYAWLWNVACFVEYLEENEDMVREALSQWPEDSPFHRQDRKPQAQAAFQSPSTFSQVALVPAAPFSPFCGYCQHDMGKLVKATHECKNPRQNHSTFRGKDPGPIFYRCETCACKDCKPRG